jgi:hypothetical protein
MISLLSNHEREKEREIERERITLTNAFPTSRYTHWVIERDEKERENRKRTELE